MAIQRNILSQELRRLRVSRALTQEELAKRAGKSIATVRKAESGGRDLAQIKRLLRLETLAQTYRGPLMLSDHEWLGVIVRYIVIWEDAFSGVPQLRKHIPDATISAVLQRLAEAQNENHPRGNLSDDLRTICGSLMAMSPENFKRFARLAPLLSEHPSAIDLLEIFFKK